MSWEQTGNALTAAAHFVESKVGKTGLTVTVDVYRKSGTWSEIVSGASATEIGDGFYEYTLASGSVTVEGLYLFLFKTTTETVDQQHIPAAYLVGMAGVENLDAAVSTRLASSGYTAPPLAADNADAVWDEALGDHAGAGSAGQALAAAGSSSDPLLNTVPGTYAQGSAGWALGQIGPGNVTVVAPAAGDPPLLTLVRGDDYHADDGRAITFSSTGWPDLTGVTAVKLTVRKRVQAFGGSGTDDVLLSVSDDAGARQVGGATQSVRFNLAAADTAKLLVGAGAGKYDVQATVGGHTLTLVTGLVTVVEDQTR